MAVVGESIVVRGEVERWSSDLLGRVVNTGKYRKRRLSDTTSPKKLDPTKSYVAWEEHLDGASASKKQKVKGSDTDLTSFFLSEIRTLKDQFEAQLKAERASTECRLQLEVEKSREELVTRLQNEVDKSNTEAETRASKLEAELETTTSKLNLILESNPLLYSTLNSSRHLAAVALMEYANERVTFHMKKQMASMLLSNDWHARKWFGNWKVFWEGDVSDISWKRSFSWCLHACMQLPEVEGPDATWTPSRQRLPETAVVQFNFQGTGVWAGMSAVERCSLKASVLQLMKLGHPHFPGDFKLVWRSRVLEETRELHRYQFSETEVVHVVQRSSTIDTYWRELGYNGEILSASWSEQQETSSPVSKSLVDLLHDAEACFAAELGLESWGEVHKFLGIHHTTLTASRNGEVHLFGLHPWRKGTKSKSVPDRITNERAAHLRKFQEDGLLESFSLMDLKKKCEVLIDISNNLQKLDRFYTVFEREFKLLIELVRKRVSQITAACVRNTLKIPLPLKFSSGIILDRSSAWSPSNGWEKLLEQIENDADIFKLVRG